MSELTTRLKKLLDGQHNLSESALEDIEEAAEQIEQLQAQLPESMQGCTIIFKECEKGHGWLTATNWIQHDCPTCRIEHLQTELAKSQEQKIVDAINNGFGQIVDQIAMIRGVG